MATAPMCKLCGARHWLSQGHVFKSDTPTVTKAVTKRPAHTVQQPNNVTRGRPKVYSSNAARQAAYRERKIG